ncbi:MAG: hypothetical protein IT385_00945 [Deltaproteobacteria bacterium]|nr:hypothetical protein [Deltaproteobacteria bacterium]
MRIVTTAILLVNALVPARAAEPKPPAPRTLDATMLEMTVSHGIATIELGVGRRDGLADGDEVRLECERLVGYVTWVRDDRAAFRISEEAVRAGPAIARARVTLGGARSEAWCPSGVFPASAPNAPKAVVDLGIRTLLADGDHVVMSLHGGGERGVAVGDEVRLPCVDAVGRVFEADRYVARGRIAASALAEQPPIGDARVSLRALASEPWCWPAGSGSGRGVVVTDGFVDVGVLTPIPEGHMMTIVVNRGTMDGIAVGDNVRAPCFDAVGTVFDVYALRSRLRIARAAFERDPGLKTLRVTLGGKPAAPWCPR